VESPLPKTKRNRPNPKILPPIIVQAVKGC
jgi:hypothetical protein